MSADKQGAYGPPKQISPSFDGSEAPALVKREVKQELSPGEVPDPVDLPVEDEEWRDNLQIRLICKECKTDPPDLREDHASGDLCCGECGLILSERMVDMSAEWRTFADEGTNNDDPSRVGDAPNPLLSNEGLQTTIAYGDGSQRSKELHRAQNKANGESSNSALMKAFPIIDRHVSHGLLGNDVATAAKLIFKEAEESKLFKGKSNNSLIAGSIFIACRRTNNPRTFREIHLLTDVSKKDIGRTFKLLEHHLSHQSKQKAQKLLATAKENVAVTEEYTATPNAAPRDLIARPCAILKVRYKIQTVAEDIADHLSKVGSIAGRSPVSQAAVCLYVASHLMGDPHTAKVISAASQVSESTIKSAYKLLWPDREKIIDPAWLTEKQGGSLSRLPNPSA